MRSPRPLAAVVALLGLLAALGGAVALRRSTRTAAASSSSGGDAVRAPGADSAGAEHYTCPCGHELRRVGEGRHVVYWELEADAGDPLLDPRCPACARGLPPEPAVVPD